MDFSPNKLQQFSKKISSLRDQPNMQPSELKAYFDSSPEEVRQAHNGLCDALTTATTQSTAAANIGFSRTAGVPADTVQAAVENVQSQLTDAVLGNIPSGSVTGDKLAQDVRDRFSTIETSAAKEVTNRTSAVNAEASARTAADNNLQTKINLKCEVIAGSYTGDYTQNRFINLGKTPKAVLVVADFGVMYFDNFNATFGGLAVTGSHAYHYGKVGPAVSICNNGFMVTAGGSNGCVATNRSNTVYNYIAFI